jgi:menin
MMIHEYLHNFTSQHYNLCLRTLFLFLSCVGEETMEITWHGKIAEDKRGQSVIPGIEAHTWLYLAGNPVICTRYTGKYKIKKIKIKQILLIFIFYFCIAELAVMVLSINPSLSSTSVCAELSDLQQHLLWILYDREHLKNYPMGLMYLGEMEENHQTSDRPSCESLYEEAIQSSIAHYKNHHVYPYSCKGNYHYRNENFREAFRCWADAGDVIRLYNYSRDDEEIYKEFLDIANEQIPHIMKTESSGHSAKR